MKSANHSYMVSELIRSLEYQHPIHVSTFSTCIKCKAKSSRGGTICGSCVELELAELVGRSLAWEIHQALVDYNRLKYEAIYGGRDESQNQKTTP